MKITKNSIITLASIVTGIGFLLYMMRNVFSHLLTPKERMYFIVIVLGVVCAIVFYTLLAMEAIHLKYEFIFMITVLLWGAIYTFVFPFSNGSDETKHFATAYYNANVVLNRDISMGLSGGRIEDIWVDYGNNGNIYDILRPWYLVISEGNWVTQQELGSADIGLPCMPNLWWKYFPATVGIVVGRLLNLGHFGLLYFARYFNTIYVALLGALAIHIAPRGKPQLAYIGMIPLFLGVSASYNYDAVFLPFIMLYMAIVLKIYDAECVRLRDVIYGVICFIIFTMHKTYLAFYIVLMFYALWKKREKISIKITKLLPVMAIIILVGCIGLKYVFNVMKIVINSSGNVHYDGSVTQTFTVGYMLTHLYQTASVVFHTITDRGWWILRQVFLGQELIGFSFGLINDSLIVAFIVLLVVFLYKSKSCDTHGHICTWGWLITLTSLGAIILGALIRFIPTDYVDSGRTITGRYILPLFLFMIPLFGGKQEKKRDYIVYYFQNILLIIMVCSVLYEIFTCRNFVVYLGS